MWGSKSRSLGQTLRRPRERHRDHILGPNFTKLSQNVNIHNNLDEFDTRSRTVKSRSLGQILQNIVNALEITYFAQILTKIGGNFCENESLNEFENGSISVKNRLQGHISKTPREYPRDNVTQMSQYSSNLFRMCV